MNNRVVIIGAGNVSWHIARRLKQADYIVQVYGRNPEDGADFTDISFVSDIHQLDRKADCYILGIKDAAVVEVAASLPFKLRRQQLLLHTSGTLSSEVLKPYAQFYGVLWPIMSLKKNHEVTYPERIPYVVTASSQEAEYMLTKLAAHLTHTLSYADDLQRQKMHLMAVVTNNFTNHLFTLAHRYCIDNQIDFNRFNPIIVETVNRIQGEDPAALQTGPAVRGDHDTINRHLAMLNSDDALSKLYRDFSESILKMYKP